MKLPTMLLALCLVAAACSQDGARLAESTDPVLVPQTVTEPSKFWNFEVPQPNNYILYSHFSVEFDPDIDQSKSVLAYQIGDVDAFDPSRAVEDPLSEQAIVRVLANFDQPGDECQATSADTVTCEFDVARPDPLPLSVRRVETAMGPTLLLILGNDQASVAYMGQDFRELAPAQADDYRR